MIYRFFRFIVHFTQEQFIWRLNGVRNHLEKIDQGSTKDTCQVMSIIYRKKIREGDISNSNDLVCWHEKFVDPTVMLAPDPCWTLYTLDTNFAYFLLMPKPWPWYNARRAPFIFMQQFSDATKSARIPLKTFSHFAEKFLPNPKGRVVYYSNGARTGSTLLLRVMQVSDERIVCLGEPEAFAALATLKNRGYVNHDFCVDLSRAIFKYCCKHQLPGQTYLIKVASTAVQIVPHIKKSHA